jgi:hypothetical protein
MTLWHWMVLWSLCCYILPRGVQAAWYVERVYSDPSCTSLESTQIYEVGRCAYDGNDGYIVFLHTMEFLIVHSCFDSDCSMSTVATSTYSIPPPQQRVHIACVHDHTVHATRNTQHATRNKLATQQLYLLITYPHSNTIQQTTRTLPCATHNIQRTNHKPQTTNHKPQTTQHNTQHTTHNTQHTTHITQHTTHNTQHTTHNTQHTTHNTQHTTHPTPTPHPRHPHPLNPSN